MIFFSIFGAESKEKDSKTRKQADLPEDNQLPKALEQIRTNKNCLFLFPKSWNPWKISWSKGKGLKMWHWWQINWYQNINCFHAAPGTSRENAWEEEEADSSSRELFLDSFPSLPQVSAGCWSSISRSSFSTLLPSPSEPSPTLFPRKDLLPISLLLMQLIPTLYF